MLKLVIILVGVLLLMALWSANGQSGLDTEAMGYGAGCAHRDFLGHCVADTGG